MGAGEALMVALSGFLVVFLMLIILWGIIVMINKVVTAIEKKAEDTAVPSFPEEPVRQEAPAAESASQTYGGEIALYDVDEKTAATIMAIISHETQIPLNQLVFKSIRAVE